MRGQLVLLGLCGTLLSCASPSEDVVDAPPGTDAASALDAMLDGGEGGGLRVATVNLRCLLDDWATRVELLASQIGAVDPDVLALQEVCRLPDQVDALPQLLSRLTAATGRSYRFVRTETHLSWDEYQEGIAIVTPHEIGAEQIIHLPAGVFPRSLVAAHVSTPHGQLLFASTHLSFGEDQASVRAEQLAAARAGLATIRDNDEPVALAGDFNEEPDGGAIGAAVADGYLDSWATIHPAAHGATFPSSEPAARIDYVLVLADGDVATISTAEVFLDQPQGDRYPSDHLGLRILLEMH